MRVRTMLALMAGLLLAASPAWAGILGPTGMGVDRPPKPVAAPDFSLPTLDGGTASLSALRGHVVLLHFWASWCPPCRQEFPELAAMAAHYGKSLTLLAVDADSNDAKGAARFAAKQGIMLPIAIDANGNVENSYGIRALPTTYLIDRHGNVVGRIVGARDWTSPAARRLITELLAPQPAPSL